jgi:hypothetical protein
MTSGGVDGPNLPGEGHLAPSPSSIPPEFGMPNQSRARRRRGVFPLLGVVVAILLATAALVVALMSRGQQSAETATENTSTISTPPSDTAAADRALCEAIAPLLKESGTEKNQFAGLGKPGSPERDAGVDAFTNKTQDWVQRAQTIMDAHADPSRYVTRTLQRYIDDMRIIAFNVRPGPGADADAEIWNDSIAVLAGPYEVCNAAGVQLW